jgi:exosortase
VGGILALACGPPLILHLQQIWLRPHYQFFPLALLGAAVLAWARLQGLGALTPGPAGKTALLLAAAWGLLAAAELLYSSWLGAVAALVLLAAVLYGVGGGRLFRAALPAWVLLWLLVPPPFELDRRLILALQAWTSWWSSSVLDFLGVFHVLAGNVVEINGRPLLVEEACAGINSLFSVLACTVFFVFLVRRPPVRAVLLIAAAVGWVLAANVARVVGVVYLLDRCDLDLTTGWRHDAFGMALFGLALVLIWSTDRLLLFLAAPAAPVVRKTYAAPAGAEPSRPAAVPNPTRLPDLRRAWVASWPVAACFAVLALAWPGWYRLAAGVGASPPDQIAPRLGALAGNSMPRQLGKWERQKFTTETRNPGSAFGETSRIWRYRLGSSLAAFSLDSPFPGWHDLTRCYTGQGWTVDGEVVHPGATGDPEKALGYVELKLTRAGYRSGYLLFCQFDGRGQCLEPRRGGASLSLHRHQSILRRWWDRMHGVSEDSGSDPPGPVYQLQWFVESYAPLTAAEQAQARAAFLQGWKVLHRHWFPPGRTRREEAAPARVKTPGGSRAGGRKSS